MATTTGKGMMQTWMMKRTGDGLPRLMAAAGDRDDLCLAAAEETIRCVRPERIVTVTTL
jgi:hypothetical protein